MARKKITGVYLDPNTKKYYVDTRISHTTLDTPIKLKKRGFDRASDAREYLDNEKERILSNINIYSSQNSEFSLYLAIEDFMDDYSSKNKASTTQTQKVKVKNHIYSYFDEDILIKNIKSSHIKAWKKWLIAKRLTPAITNSVLRVMERILKRATLHGAIFPNDIYLDLENVNTSSVVKEKMKFYTIEEFKQFISVIEDKWHTFFMTMFFTGTRIGECRALMWDDVDFIKQTITINRQANNKTGSGSDEITTLKTSSAYRTIPMPAPLLSELKQYKEQFDKDEFISGDYLFFGTKPITPSSVERAAKKYMKLANVKEIRIHDFRHSFASMYIHLGANPNTLAKIMGHASAKETLDTYADMYPDEDVKIADKISTIF